MIPVAASNPEQQGSPVMEELRADLSACRLCADRFAATATRHSPRPVVWFRPGARLLIASQAPGLRVHDAQILVGAGIRNRKELAEAGADMVLYPLSAFRAMNKAALTVYQNILEKGDQKDVVDMMQTRMELYDFLNYHDFEQKLDQLFQQSKG